MAHSIPIIDLASADIRETSHAFGDALANFGFAVVVNHGVPKQLLDRAYSVAGQTFALPEEVKRKYECLEDGRFTGYCSFGGEGAKDSAIGDLKEFWHYRVHVPAGRMRIPLEVPGFGATVLELYEALDQLSNRLLGRLDDYLGQAHGTFAGMTHCGPSLLRLLHYPPLVGNEEGIRAAAHEDINLITLLVSATASGLEAQTRSGEWIPVNNPPDAIVVNSGDMLQMYTNGRIPSTTHRVVNGNGERRYSIPFFCHPRAEVVLRKNPPMTAGEYLQERLAEINRKT